MKGQSNFRLDLVRIEGVQSLNLEENERERDEGEDKEKEENVVAKEKVIGFCGGVIEPEGFGEGEVATESDLGVVEGMVRNHRRRRRETKP